MPTQYPSRPGASARNDTLLTSGWPRNPCGSSRRLINCTMPGLSFGITNSWGTPFGAALIPKLGKAGRFGITEIVKALRDASSLPLIDELDRVVTELEKSAGFGKRSEGD